MLEWQSFDFSLPLYRKKNKYLLISHSIPVPGLPGEYDGSTLYLLVVKRKFPKNVIGVTWSDQDDRGFSNKSSNKKVLANISPKTFSNITIPDWGHCLCRVLFYYYPHGNTEFKEVPIPTSLPSPSGGRAI